MSSVPAGKRSWKCPDCGAEVLLSVTQLDPIACETCLAKVKGKPRPTAEAGVITEAKTTGPLGVWTALPETTKLVIAAVAFVIGLLLGLMVGFAAGKATAPRIVQGSGTESSKSSPVPVETEEERPEPPGPGYKWVRGRERKDGSGTRFPGHWAKDPLYKGEDVPSSKKKKDSSYKF